MIARNYILAAIWPALVYLSNFSQSSLYLSIFSSQLCTYLTFPINCVLIQLFPIISALIQLFQSVLTVYLSNFSNQLCTYPTFPNYLCTYPTFPINGVLIQLFQSTVYFFNFFSIQLFPTICVLIQLFQSTVYFFNFFSIQLFPIICVLIHLFPIICVLTQRSQSTTQSRDSPTGPHDVSSKTAGRPETAETDCIQFNGQLDAQCSGVSYERILTDGIYLKLSSHGAPRGKQFCARCANKKKNFFKGANWTTADQI